MLRKESCNIKHIKLQNQKTTTTKMQKQTAKKKNANTDGTKLRDIKNISSRSNMKLSRL